MFRNTDNYSVSVANEQDYPGFFIDRSSVNTSSGLLTSLLIGILPVLVAGLLSPPLCPATPVCPVTTPCSLTTVCPACPLPTPCPLTTACPAITPCPVTTPCPPPPLCEPIPACPDPFIQLLAGGIPIENRCFLFVRSAASFRDAIIDCAGLGGYLLNIQTDAEGQAVQEYLSANFPSSLFWFGYTNFVANNDVVGLSRGPTPIPRFGQLPAAVGQICLRGSADPGGAPQLGVTDCSNQIRYICDINLTTQKCVCPP